VGLCNNRAVYPRPKEGSIDSSNPLRVGSFELLASCYLGPGRSLIEDCALPYDVAPGRLFSSFETVLSVSPVRSTSVLPFAGVEGASSGAFMKGNAYPNISTNESLHTPFRTFPAPRSCRAPGSSHLRERHGLCMSRRVIPCKTRALR
jgi:hypothetical protein